MLAFGSTPGHYKYNLPEVRVCARGRATESVCLGVVTDPDGGAGWAGASECQCQNAGPGPGKDVHRKPRAELRAAQRCFS